jgi:hypothetical protein
VCFDNCAGVLVIRVLVFTVFFVLFRLCTGCPKKIVPFFYFFFLGALCVESGVSCTDCY